MEQLHNDLQAIQQYNRKLIKKHGHQDLQKLKEAGIYNYADFLDVETTKKLKKWRKQKKSKVAKTFDLDA